MEGPGSERTRLDPAGASAASSITIRAGTRKLTIRVSARPKPDTSAQLRRTGQVPYRPCTNTLAVHCGRFATSASAEARVLTQGDQAAAAQLRGSRNLLPQPSRRAGNEVETDRRRDSAAGEAQRGHP